MFYRRRLPHWHPDISEAIFLFVTWRLPGSIQRARLPQRSARESACPHLYPLYSLAGPSSPWIAKADKAAFRPAWLLDTRVARVVADALMHGKRGRHFYLLRA